MVNANCRIQRNLSVQAGETVTKELSVQHTGTATSHREGRGPEPSTAHYQPPTTADTRLCDTAIAGTGQEAADTETP